MDIRPLSIEEFNNFQKNHPLSSFYQTVNYGMLKAENGYDYEIIGLVDKDNKIHGASLILIKEIGIQLYYGYAPRGFLIDYQNEQLINIFTQKLKEYYASRNIVFIKCNPNIPIGEVNTKNFSVITNDYYKIKYTLPNYNFKKLADNMYFEAKLPRFNAFVDLKHFDGEKISKNTKNKVKKGVRKGLVFERFNKDGLGIFYDLVKNNIDKNEYYYHDYYTAFAKDDAIDLFLISVNYEYFLQNSGYLYDQALENNNKLNDKLAKYKSEKNINAKMASDRVLLSYKNDILEASKGMSERRKTFIAGALVVKHNNSATIVMSAHDIKYKRFCPNYFLYYNIIKFYQNSNFDYVDLNGVVGDFKNENPYTGLNRFKLGFNPRIFEFIGEYDFIINPKMYDVLLKNGSLAKEFNKRKNNEKESLEK